MATRKIQEGEKIKRNDLTTKRPGSGIPPNRINSVVGSTVNRTIEADTLVRKSDLENSSSFQ
ncbi:MAG: SAF domain-containing protein [bacterium]